MHPLVDEMNMLLQLVAVAVQIILVEPELLCQELAQAFRERRALRGPSRFIQR